MKSDKIERFEKLVTDENSGWLQKALWRKANKRWLNQSRQVALNVLETLDTKNWSQKRLAQEMGVSSQQVSKSLKGQQNLTFETVAKLENALGIRLMEIVTERSTTKVKSSVKISSPIITEAYSVREITHTSSFRFTGKKSMTIVHRNLGALDTFKLIA